jgi:hypothetical protein
MGISWEIVQAGWWLVALGLPLVLLATLPRPRRWRWRVPVVVLISWVALLVYTSEIYFRVGAQRAMQHGIANPRLGFDNNNFVPVLLLGWLLPLASCGLVLVLQAIRRTRAQDSQFG